MTTPTHVVDPFADDGAVEDLVLGHLGLARGLAARYRNRGEPLEDLVQVAHVGLVKAARRFRPDAGTSFVAYATPTITGEIRRHFRDHGWDVRPPRRLQELRARLRAAELERPGDRVSDEQIAHRIGATTAEVRAAREAANAYCAMSLDARVGDAEDTTLGDVLAVGEDPTAAVDDRLALAGATAELTDRERFILRRRFEDEATQSQIAAELGVSQMQVSRLLAALLQRLRVRLEAQTPVREATAERGRRAADPVPAWSRMPSSSSRSTSWAA